MGDKLEAVSGIDRTQLRSTLMLMTMLARRGAELTQTKIDDTVVDFCSELFQQEFFYDGLDFFMEKADMLAKLKQEQ